MAQKISCLLTAAIIVLLQTATAGVVKNIDRTITFSESDPLIITQNVKFMPESSDDKFYQYTVAGDFASTLIAVSCTDVLRGEDATLPIKQVFTKSMNLTMVWFEVDISDLVAKSKDQFVYLQFSEMHKRRKNPFPPQASIMDTQSFKFTDSAVVLSPYKVETQTLEIELPKGAKVVGITKHPQTTYEDKKIQYAGIQHNTPANSFDQIQVMFENSRPYVILKEATRKIGVSHWGNIQVDEHFRLENIGPKVKGQYSRYDIDINKGGKGCLKNLNSEYPFYVKGMYVGDYIGNISSTNAFRSASSVELELRSRYPVCGGWQNDWNQGYNMPTRFHLSESTTVANLYKLSIPYYHNYDVLLTEDYTVEVVLPLGATNIKVDLPFDAEISTDGVSFNTLDYMGAPVVTIKSKNANSLLEKGDLTITYSYAPLQLIMKPLYLSSIIFVMLVALIVTSRVNFSLVDADDDDGEQKQKQE